MSKGTISRGDSVIVKSSLLDDEERTTIILRDRSNIHVSQMDTKFIIEIIGKIEAVQVQTDDTIRVKVRFDTESLKCDFFGNEGIIKIWINMKHLRKIHELEKRMMEIGE